MTMVVAEPAEPKDEPLPVTMPDEFFAKTDARWIVIRVERRLDWRNALKGVKVVLGSQPQLKWKTGPPSELRDLNVMIDDIREPFSLMPLRPKSQGDHKLVPAGRVDFVLRFFKDLLKDKAPVPGSQRPDLDGQSLQLIPMDADGSGVSVPLVHWEAGPLWSEAGLEHLRFKLSSQKAAMSSKRVSTLRGKFTDAMELNFSGKKPSWPKRPTTSVYLVGMQATGSKKVYVTEADNFMVSCQDKQPDEPDVGNKLLSGELFKKARKNAIDDFGAAKKQKLVATLAERVIHEDRVANLEESMEDLRARADSIKPRQGQDFALEQEMVLRRKLLPKFNTKTKEAPEIYGAALWNEVAPKDCLAAEDTLFDDDFVALLMANPVAVEEMDHSKLVERCKSRVVAEVVLTRVREGVKETDMFEAQDTARRMGALNALVSVYKAKGRGGPWKGDKITETLGLAQGSRLLNHYKTKFFKDKETGEFGRLDENKLLCHMLVFALHLTPRLAMDFKEVYEDLKVDFGSIKKFLRYVGCRDVDVKMHNKSSKEVGIRSLKASLKGPLQVNPNRNRPMKTKKRD